MYAQSETDRYWLASEKLPMYNRYQLIFFVRGRHETTIINENHHFLLSSYCRPTKILKGANKT